MTRSIIFPGEQPLPAIGQGTWNMGESHTQRQQEIRALQVGLERGLKVIDTAEMYAEGRAEEVVGEALKGRRDSAWLVSKVYPWHAGEADMSKACEGSLRRLQTDYLDLYLLHWRGSVALEETIRAMERLQQQGKIRYWGVSNLDSEEMESLWRLPGGNQCATDQVLYHLASRGIEYDVLPWCQQRQIPLMAYSPLAQAGRLRHALLNHATLCDIAQQKGISVAQLLLAWVIREPGVLAIPKASSVAHVAENAGALAISLTQEELARLDEAFPAPPGKQPLEMI